MINFYRLRLKWEKHRNGIWIKNGIPFLLFILLSSFALKKFAEVRYDKSKYKRANTKQLRRLGFTVPGEEEIEKEVPSDEDIYVETIKNMQQNYDNIRGPREYEDNVDAIELIARKIEEAKKKNPNTLFQSGPQVHERLEKLFKGESHTDKDRE